MSDNPMKILVVEPMKRPHVQEIDGSLASMQKLDAEQLTKLVDEILPNVENDITPVDMIRLMALLPDIGDYELSESRIPYDGLFTSQNEMLVPDFDATISRLHETLYGAQ